MAYFTKKEQEYMDYLDDIYDCEPPYGLLLIKAYPEMFRVGMKEFFIEKEHQTTVDKKPNLEMKILSKQESEQLQRNLITYSDKYPEELLDELCDVVMKFTKREKGEIK